MAKRKDPQFVDQENDTLHYFHHFADRLERRYDLGITMDEYLELCKQELNLLYVLTPNKRVGYVTFKGKTILVVRCNASRLLNTCLMEGQPLMTPNKYKNRGISQEQFNGDLDAALSKIEIMAGWLRDNPDKKRAFFTEDIFNSPNWMYGAAYRKAGERDYHWLATVIKNLYNS